MKYALKIYDMKNQKVIKTVGRDVISVSLYMKYQEMAESVQAEKVKSDIDLFKKIKDLFLETFTDLTEDEYFNNTDPAEVLSVWNNILSKGVLINTKN